MAETIHRAPGARRGLAAALAVLACTAFAACGPGDDSRPKGTLADLAALRDRDDLNVLFVLVDTLRADRLHAYGYERETTPNLDALARTGIRFAEHIAQSSWTKCSMASLWTGLQPNRTGVLRAQHALPERARLPAEIFREAGFRTAALYRNAWLDRKAGFAQGFEIYAVPQVSRAVAAAHRNEPRRVPLSDGDVMRSASEFLRVHAGERWFLYLHLIDVHQYVSDDASAVFGLRYSDAYDNAVLWTDQLMGHLLADLEQRGLRDRTLVIFASDHGEAFGEHGREGHARDVYGEVTEVPLILGLPFRLDPGVVVEARSQNVDLWPTILDLIGLPSLEDPDGRSLVPAILAAAGAGGGPEEPATAFAQIDATWGRMSHEPSPIVAVSDGPWRLVHHEDRPEGLELYDTASDPREQRNLALEEPDIAQQLSREARSYLTRSSAPWGDTPSIEIDEMDLDLLRAIGYGVHP